VTTDDFNNELTTDSTNWGLMGRFSAGKEWWAGSDWGLGAAFEFGLARMSVPGAEAITAKEFGLLFSVSYN